MSEPKLISPLLDNFIIGDPISDHHGVRCCPAMQKDTDAKYIVKIISIPASQTKLDALLLTGAYPNVEAAMEYFKELVNDTVNELEVLQLLSRQEGFVGCEAYQVVPMDDGNGYEIYLLTPYRRTLEKQCRKQPITHLNAINLGLDICSALAACRRNGYLFTDLKPTNIYIDDNNEYKIGDIGFINLASLKFASLPEKNFGPYTAPEIQDAFSALNDSIDIYALGMILYQLYNGGQLPDMTAETLPAPAYADSEMSQIILKAVEKDPQNRWQTPAQMGQAIVSFMQRNGAEDLPITPVVDPVAESVSPAEEDTEIESAADIVAVLDDLLGTDIDNAASDEPFENDLQPEETEAVQVIEPIQPAEDISKETSQVECDEPEESSAEIVPLCEDSTEVAEEDTQPVEANETQLESDAVFETLNFLDDPDIVADSTDYSEISEELSKILTQADELAQMEIPDPPVAPEPIDVPVPPLPVEEPVDEEVNTDTVELINLAMTLDSPEEAEQADDQLSGNKIEEDVIAYEEDAPAEKPKKKRLMWLIISAAAIVVLIAGILFYQLYYLQPIDNFEITGTKDKLFVTVTSDIEDEKLSVLCENALYGTTVTVPVVDGKASFSGLLADTEYVVTLQIDGFHKLTGKTSATYYTPDESQVVQFTALTGSVDGSIELNFILEGPDDSNWTVQYETAGTESQSVSFTGHSVTLTGLTVGQEYTATITPSTDLYLTGTTSVTFIASNVINAEDLAINSLANGQLSASWKTPGNEVVEGWKVRCYNTSGYDKTITTNDTKATFTDLDSTKGYTVEVTAVGQTATQIVEVGENAITLTNVSAVAEADGTIRLSWDSEQIPEGGWIISYEIEGMEEKQTINANTNSVVLVATIPGLSHKIFISSADSRPVVYTPVSCTPPASTNFIREYSGYTVTRNNLSFGMCRTPKKANWTYKDVPGKDYTRVYSVGQKASFIIFLNRVYGSSSEMIHTVFAFYNADGQLIDVCTSSRTWSEMWSKNYCEMEIPEMPTAAGSYTVRLYFNGDYVTTQSFSITD